MSPDQTRAESFCRRFGLKMPVLLAPMAGACPPSLSIAMMNAGSLGACGALLMQPDEIVAWAEAVRVNGNGPYQLNLWIPDPTPHRDTAHEDRVRAFLERFGPPVPVSAGDAKPPDFAAQCEALLAIKPPIVSSIMGLYPAAFVAQAQTGRYCLVRERDHCGGGPCCRRRRRGCHCRAGHGGRRTPRHVRSV